LKRRLTIKNRTFPELKNTLTKNGGRIADAGSVMFQFTRKGVINVASVGEDALMTILECGAEDAVEEDGEIIVYTKQKDLASVRNAIIDAGLKVQDAGLQYVPNHEIEINDMESARKIIKLLDAIDDLDDVVNVYHNANITVDIEN